MSRTLKPCGTHAAYRRHLRSGERPCPLCAEAARRESEKWRRSRGGRPLNRARCGTYSGWMRHHKDGQTPCGPCWRAARPYWREQKRRLHGYKRLRKVEKPSTIGDAIVDLLETWYPDRLDTEILVARLLDIHPEWSAESIRRVMFRELKDRVVHHTPAHGDLQSSWQAANASWETNDVA